MAVVTCEARRLSEEFLVLLPFEGSSHEIAITRILGGLQRARSSDILVPMMRSDVARRTAILGHYDEVVARSGRGS